MCVKVKAISKGKSEQNHLSIDTFKNMPVLLIIVGEITTEFHVRRATRWDRPELEKGRSFLKADFIPLWGTRLGEWITSLISLQPTTAALSQNPRHFLAF